MAINPFKQFSVFLSKNIKEEFIPDMFKRWNESNRAYHNIDHLIDIIKTIEKNPSFNFLSIYEKNALLLAAFFHDVIYDPKRKDNEDESIRYFKAAYQHDNDPKTIKVVCDLIEVTKHRRRPLSTLQRIFWDADNDGFNRGYDNLLKNEVLIRKEFSHVSSKEYREGRLKFLESCLGLFNQQVDKDLKKLMEFVKKTY